MKGVIPESVVPGPSGHLELSEELLKRLVCTEPLEKYYDVEDEPFARVHSNSIEWQILYSKHMNKRKSAWVFLDTEKAFDKVWIPGLLLLKPHLPGNYYRRDHRMLWTLFKYSNPYKTFRSQKITWIWLKGKYATVKKCREKTSGRQFAAKFLKRSRSKDKRGEILHEVAVLEACKPCSRVVNLHQVFESTNEMVLLLELACGGELQMLLDRDEEPTEGQVQTLMKQIMDGISYLHSINVAHLDIKPQNLVLTGAFPNCQVKLCDFGISRYLSKGSDVREILGTPDYVAPEVLNFESISLATDMWSVGVLLYVLLTGCSPFGGDNKQETFYNITLCRLDFPDDLFEDISEEAKDLMTKLMVKTPSERLTAKQCLEHAWFAKDLGESQLPVPTDVPAPTSPRPQPSPRLSLKLPAPKETRETEEKTNGDDNNNAAADRKRRPAVETPVAEPRTPDNNNVMPPSDNATSTPNNNGGSRGPRGLSEERRRSLKSSLDVLAKRLDNERELTRVESFSSRQKATRMQTMPSIRYSNNNNNNNINDTASMVFKFQRAVVIDDDEGLPPSPVSTDNSSMSDSNSDTISEMSIDSSSDRSSIISLDDSLDFPYKLRHYSSCGNVWEATRRPSPRWPPPSNEGYPSTARFRDRPRLAVYSGPPRRSIGLDIVRGTGNLVVIREHKAVNHRFATTRELKCESVRSKIRKFQLPETKPELNNVF